MIFNDIIALVNLAKEKNIEITINITPDTAEYKITHYDGVKIEDIRNESTVHNC